MSPSRRRSSALRSAITEHSRHALQQRVIRSASAASIQASLTSKASRVLSAESRAAAAAAMRSCSVLPRAPRPGPLQPLRQIEVALRVRAAVPGERLVRHASLRVRIGCRLPRQRRRLRGLGARHAQVCVVAGEQLERFLSVTRRRGSWPRVAQRRHVQRRRQRARPCSDECRSRTVLRACVIPSASPADGHCVWMSEIPPGRSAARVRSDVLRRARGAPGGGARGVPRRSRLQDPGSPTA
jgi:hypothetical protein